MKDKLVIFITFIELCEKTSEFPDEAKMRWTCEVTAPIINWLNQVPAHQIERMKNLVRNKQISFGAMLCNVSALYNTEEFIQSLYPIISFYASLVNDLTYY